MTKRNLYSGRKWKKVIYNSKYGKWYKKYTNNVVCKEAARMSQ